MIAPRSRGAGRFLRSAAALLLAASSWLGSACASTESLSPAVSIQALDGWSDVAAPSARAAAARAMDDLSASEPAGRLSSEGEALSGERPGIRVTAGSSGRWAETVLRFGADGKMSPPDGVAEAPGSDSAATTALLARRTQGTQTWQAVEIPASRARTAIARIATSTRGDLVALAALGPRAMDAARRAAAAAGSERNIPVAAIELESIEEVTWPTSALGLPKPGMVYAMMLVPGHRVTLRLPGGGRCTVHTSSRQALVAPAGATESPR